MADESAQAAQGMPPPRPLGFDPTMVLRTLRYLLDPDHCVEMRVLGARFQFDKDSGEFLVVRSDYGKGVVGSWFSDPDAFVAEAHKARRVSVYVCLNPVDRVLLARKKNRLAKLDHTTTARDVACLRWAFVDIDAGNPPDTSATDEERAAAVAKRNRILADHPELAAHALWGSSGNGCWVWVRLPDYPNDDRHRALVADFLARLGAMYPDGVGKVDQKTRDPSRIGPLPGTLKCKGEHLPERPYRLATIEGAAGAPLPEDPADDPDLTPLDLAAWLADHPAPAQPPRPMPAPAPPAPVAQAGRTRRDAPRHLILGWATKFVDDLPPAVSGQGGHNATFSAATLLVKAYGLSVEEARPLLERYNARCQPPWEPHELDHKLRSADELADDKPRGYLLDTPWGGEGRAEAAGGAAPPGGQGGGAGAAPAGPQDGVNFTDMGNATRLLRAFGHRLLYCPPYGKWLYYDDQRWMVDDRDVVANLVQQVPDLIRAEVPPGANQSTVESYGAWAFRTESRERLAAAMAVARSRVPVLPSELDGDPWLLNVLNGTIDLSRFRGHDPADRITKVAPVVYDPEARCPHWEKATLEIMNDNPDTLDFLQRSFGYAITGIIREHVFTICCGSGGNGKTLIFTTIGNILGDYAIEIDSDLLLAQSSGQHPTGLTDLEGRRFVVAEESDDSRRLAEALIKRLTGGNRIRARKMREDFYEFPPSHHLFFATNHRPDVRNTDIGMWRRIRLIPFEVCFVPRERGGRQADDTLATKFSAERSGILNWLLEGCRKWQARGLAEPGVIMAATQGYRDDQDFLASFLEERCEVGEGAQVPSRAVYECFQAWCAGIYSHIPSMRKFMAQITDRGFSSRKSGGTAWRLGLRLKTQAEVDAMRGVPPQPPAPRRGGTRPGFPIDREEVR